MTQCSVDDSNVSIKTQGGKNIGRKNLIYCFYAGNSPELVQILLNQTLNAT